MYQIRCRCGRLEGQAVSNFISMNLLQVKARVITAYLIVNMRGERPVTTGEAVLMRAENEAGLA